MIKELNDLARKFNKYQKEELKKELSNQFDAYGFEDYTLINNFGFTFKIDEKEFDCRYWANCYGVELNYWRID